jgi:NAD-dependent dihydropyrimidine dehydrogenase PreA subunit
MKLHEEKCLGCGQCIPYCPVGAISRNPATFKSRIDQETCVECHTCFRSNVCPAHALEIEDLTYPRSLRSVFSDVLSPHKSTGVLGRGTEEMKTNDVTGRLKPGVLGVSLELGRPGIGASFADLQTVAQAVIGVGVRFQPENPVYSLLSDKEKGLFEPEVLGERVLSALLEFEIPRGELPDLYRALKDAAEKIDTVFSVGISMIETPEYGLPDLEKELDENGIWHRPNGKTNVGLGRPLKEITA